MIKNLSRTVLILLVTHSAFSQDTTYFDSKWHETSQDDAAYVRVDQKVDGQFKRTDYFANNQIQMSGQYESLDPEIKTGQFKWFHKNGQLQHEGSFSSNKHVGKHMWYFDNGQIEAIENYSDGKLDGVFEEYNRDGNISIKTAFTNGVQQGLTQYYREDGSLHSEGMFVSGDRNGVWKYYGENGELLGTNEFKTDYTITEADLSIKLPNSEWDLTEKVEGDLTQYYFKRAAVTDSNGFEIIPAIMVFVEDASEFDQDVMLYSMAKRRNFAGKGVQIDETLIHENENFPLAYKNAFFYSCSYASNGLDHVLYMIHIINKDRKGIQIYLDMTKSISEEYGDELWKTIKSIKPL